MRKTGQQKATAIRTQALQIAMQLPDDKKDADRVLTIARELHAWRKGFVPLPRPATAR